MTPKGIGIHRMRAAVLEKPYTENETGKPQHHQQQNHFEVTEH